MMSAAAQARASQPTFHLSEDQDAALEALVEALGQQDVLCLTGPAGSGKTTLMRAFAGRVRELGREVLYAAPTGKAALRLSETTGEYASTLHSLLYGQVEEDEATGELVFSGQKRVLGPSTLLIVDEASMVGTQLHQELLDQLPIGAAMLYVGDREQLEPVNDTWGPDFDRPTAMLSAIHRQAEGNPIIEVSRRVRTGGRLPKGELGEGYSRRQAPLHEVAAWMTERVRAGDDAMVLSWTHKVRERVNAMVRSNLGYRDRLVPGDRVRVRLNNKSLGRMNGEILTVTALEPERRGRLRVTFRDDAGKLTQALVFPALIEGKPHAFKEACDRTGVDQRECLSLDYGYALTVHSSQGSEWAQVAFVIDATTVFLARKDAAAARRLTYTAVTRAAQRLQVLDVGRL